MKFRTLVLSAAITAAFAVLSSVSAQAAPRGFTVEDMVKMERVGNPALSPDAGKVIYTVRTTDTDKMRAHTEIWMLDLRNSHAVPQQLTHAAASSMDPQWSPAGDAVYFLSSRSGSDQVWRLPLTGGEARQVTDLPLDVTSFRVSPHGDRMALSVEVFRDCADLMCSKKRLDERAANKATGMVFDKLFVRHWDTWADGRNTVLYSAALDADGRVSGELANLSGTLDGDVPSKPFGDRDDYQFSPDGKSIVFSLRVAGKTEAWSTNFDLFEVPAAGGKAPQNLTADNPAWDGKPVFSPDGRTLAYVAMDRPGFEADRFHLVLMDVASGKKRTLANDWDRSVAEFQWAADGKTIYASADDVGQHRVFAVDVASGKVTPVTGLGWVAGFDVKHETIVVASHSLLSGAQLYKLNGSAQPTQLTHNNEAALADVKFGEYEQFSFAGHNGETVHGYVVKPWNAKEGGKYPIAFLVHGGPQGSFANEWGYRWNPQVYAGAGYAAVLIDFHGSTGYGQKFTDAISQDWGGAPLEDLQKGLAAAVNKYSWLDRSHACALGASYGGYMMNWIEGNWSDGFRCIVNHDGVFDNRAMFYSTEELWFDEWENGGTYYNAPQNHEKFNPINFVNNWKTPMLVVQGDKDFRIPTTQGLGTFTALQRKGIESKLLVFPDENHWVLKPANSVLWHHTVLDWLDQHLKQ